MPPTLNLTEMNFSSRSPLLFICLALSIVNCSKPKKNRNDKPQQDHIIKTLYSPPGQAPTVGAMYPRVIQIKNHAGSEGYLLATFEHYMNREPSFPIYRSTDKGETWNLFSEVEDTRNKFGMKYQPHLFELPQQVGEFPAGTIFCSGNSIPSDMSSTELLVYVSRDGGKGWEFLSSIIKGGRAIYPNTGETPVWEPFLGLDKSSRLVAYYSDERYEDKKLDQILSHKISEDGGKTWGNEVFDVAVADGKTRPGMAIVEKLPNGKYIMVFEIVGVEGIPVHYKISDDGISWGDPADLGKRIMNKEGHFLRSTPYVIWSPYDGSNGTIMVSGMAININGIEKGNGYMINKNLGEGEWTHIEAPISYSTKDGKPGGYSQTMIVMDSTGREIMQLVPVPNGTQSQMDIRYSKFKLPQ
jgi:hypothetical protein